MYRREIVYTDRRVARTADASVTMMTRGYSMARREDIFFRSFYSFPSLKIKITRGQQSEIATLV